MPQTIFEILTSEEARDQVWVEASLDKEIETGAPWFMKLPNFSQLNTPQ